MNKRLLSPLCLIISLIGAHIGSDLLWVGGLFGMVAMMFFIICDPD